jgi:hypothetical protein
MGWLIDTTHHTIKLPPHRLERLNTLLSQFLHHQWRTSRRKWQKLLGKLRSMVLAIPGGRGLFSQLQTVLTTVEMPHPSDRLCLSTAIHDQLNDIRWISSDLGTQPTRWAEAVDSSPTFLGMVDACGVGMGGTWISPNPKLNPLLWCEPFSPTISAQLMSSSNKMGTLTNSDLEQTALVCHADVLASKYDVREHTISTLSDNTAAVPRTTRLYYYVGSSSLPVPYRVHPPAQPSLSATCGLHSGATKCHGR